MQAVARTATWSKDIRTITPARTYLNQISEWGRGEVFSPLTYLKICQPIRTLKEKIVRSVFSTLKLPAHQVLSYLPS